MARYNSYGKLDSPHGVDGDMAFVKMVTRLNPEQLQQGDVAYSQNGRMDNDRTWQTRKGMKSIAESPGNGASALVLPFTLDDFGTPPVLADSAIDSTYGFMIFTDPLDDASFGIIQWLLLFTNTTLEAIAIAGTKDGSRGTLLPSDVSIPIDSAERISGNTNPIIALDGILAFRDGETALRYDGGFTRTAFVPVDGTTVSNRVGGVISVVTGYPHGLRKGSRIRLQNLTSTIDPNGDYTVATVTSPTEFTVIQDVADGTISVGGSTAVIVQKILGLVQSGAYEAVAVDTGTVTVVDGVCTMNYIAHSRLDEDILTIYDAAASGLTEGDRYEITYVDADNYTFNAEIADGTFDIQMGGKQALGGGFIHMPDPDWGVFHEGRLIVPYSRTNASGINRDELVFSDIFDSNTYDPILNQLRFGSGSGDTIVTVAPILDDRLLVLCSNSLHIVEGISGGLGDLSKYELTREVGCSARKTVTEVGGTIVWLSDQGVYSATYGQELNLIANAIPLSEPIENFIRDINWEYASKAIGVYADNRYYLAIPYLDSTVNNRMYVYNFLNRGWESIDTFPDGLEISDMAVARWEGKDRVFILNNIGGLHLFEELIGYDQVELSPSTISNISVDGELLTRAYQFGDLNHKRFTRASILKGGNGSMGVRALMQDPNLEKSFVALEPASESNAKVRINERGRSVQLLLSANDAILKGCSVDAILSSYNDITRR